MIEVGVVSVDDWKSAAGSMQEGTKTVVSGWFVVEAMTRSVGGQQTSSSAFLQRQLIEH